MTPRRRTSEFEIVPLRRVEIPGANLGKPIYWSMSILAVIIFWGLFVATKGLLIPIIFVLLFVGYVVIRSRRDVQKGWFMEERDGTIVWYAGHVERSIPIRDIEKIRDWGGVMLKSGKELRMPSADRDFLPVYRHLYQKYPNLFNDEPREDSGVLY